MAKRYTRKQLKKPDEFITTSIRIWTFVQAHALQVLVMLVVATLVIAGVWIWSHFATSRASKVTTRLTRAIEISNQVIVPMETDLPKTDEEIPRFKSRVEKLAAAEKAYSEVVDQGGALGQMSLLLRAGIRYDRRELNKAMADYTAFLARSDDSELKEIAQEGIGYCQEAAGNLDQALEAFRKLPREGEKRFRSIYHEARILALKGKKKEAAALFRQIMEQAKASSLSEQANERLALLESR